MYIGSKDLVCREQIKLHFIGTIHDNFSMQITVTSSMLTRWRVNPTISTFIIKTAKRQVQSCPTTARGPDTLTR